MGKFRLETRDTAKVPHISTVETQKIQRPEEGESTTLQTQKIKRPTVQTSELPAIPERLITSDVSDAASKVIDGLIENSSIDTKEIDMQDEMFLRRKIVAQLEDISKFMDTILHLYRDGVPTLSEQFTPYKNSIEANSNFLKDQNRKIAYIKSAIVNINTLILPFLAELKRAFGHEQDENFDFEEITTELKESIVRLAIMIREREKK